MRQVLCSLTYAAHPRLLFIDEGFGSLDKDNFDITCKKVLPGLASHFEKVIIISHITRIHDYTSTNCTIKKNGNNSQINFGQMIPGGSTLRVIDDHMESVRASLEERKQRKADSDIKKGHERAEKKAEKERLAVEAEADAQRKQNEFGESIVEDIGEGNMKCLACLKVYKKRNGFAEKHVKSKGHMKAMITFEY